MNDNNNNIYIYIDRYKVINWYKQDEKKNRNLPKIIIY